MRRNSCRCKYFQLDFRVVLFCFILFSCSSASSYGNIYRLHKDLLEDYSREIRPIENQMADMNVQFVYTLVSLNDFNAVSGRMTTTASLQIIWRDEMLNWIPSHYGGIDLMSFPESDVWVPALFLVNGADDISIKTMKSEYRSVSYNSYGYATYYQSGIIITTCDPDITYYPNDKHYCTLQFTTREMASINISLAYIYQMPGSKRNLFWQLTGVSHRKYELLSKNTVIEIQLSLERRSMYLIYTIIFPISLLNFINLLAFVLPVDSGERVSFATTMLLTLSVYLTLMSDSIPNTSDPVSILTFSLMLKLIISSLIIMTTIISLTVHRVDEDRPIPIWLVRLCCFRRKICHDANTGNFDSSSCKTDTQQLSETHGQSNDSEAGISRNSKELEEQSRSHFPVTWQTIGKSLDNALLLIFTLLTVAEIVINTFRIFLRIG